MSFELVREQQKSKSGEISTRSMTLDELEKYLGGKGKETPSSTKSTGGTGNFIVDLTAALDAYSSNKKTLDSLPTIKDPGGKGIGRFFYNLFNSKSKREEKQAKVDKEREAQEVQKQELNEAMGDALSKFSALISGANQADKKQLAGNEKLVRRIIAELPQQNTFGALDAIYTELGDKDLTLLMDIIEARFGVPVVDSSSKRTDRLSNEVKSYVFHTKRIRDANGNVVTVKAQPIDWSAAALRHVYSVYLTLPAEHMKLVRALVHYDDKSGNGAAWGSAGVYYVNYHKDYEDEVEGTFGSCTDRASDMRHGMNALDLTVTHELGHVVDGMHNNYGYSRSPEFRSWSQWVEVKNDPDAVYKYMVESMSNAPYNGTLSDKELELTKDIGKEMIKQQGNLIDSWERPKAIINTKIKGDSSLSEASKSALKAKLSSDANIADNLLYHIWMGFGGHNYADLLACYNFDKVMTGMKRPFYQGYNNDAWFSFDKSKWSNKISAYQYRCPKEEFAETYASYHMAPTATHVVNGKTVAYKKGEKTPSGLKTWFEKVGLHQSDPSKVSGTSPIKEQRA